MTAVPFRGPFPRFVLIAALLIFLFSLAHYRGYLTSDVRSSIIDSQANSGSASPDRQPEQPQPEPQQVSEIVPPTPPPEPKKPKKPDYSGSPRCIPELDYLKKESLGLTSTITYRRRCIRPVFSATARQTSTVDPNTGPIDRDVVANVSLPIADMAAIPIDLMNCEGIADDYILCDKLDLAVPDPWPKRVGQYSNITFAIATKLDRLVNAKAHFTHWMAGSGSTLIALILDKPDVDKNETRAELEEAWPAVINDYAKDGVKISLVRPHGEDHTETQSHMMVALDMLAHAREARKHGNETHWFGIIDDDTFLPALEPLAATLATYNHTEPAYLGDLSESFAATRYGEAAFGGGGIFISVPLAEELEPHLDSCRTGRGGDMQLMECIHDHSHARLQRVKGLQQQDMHGDMDGFFESGWRYLTLHHWKTWYQAPVLEMARVALICGGCFLQRWKLQDFLETSGPKHSSKAEVVFTNGYSITRYNNGAPDLSWMEGTWDGADGKDYRWSLGPIRPKLGKDEKTVWRILESVQDEETGDLTQIYVHKDDSEADAVDDVIELVWKTYS